MGYPVINQSCSEYRIDAANKILFDLDPTGASATTAGYDNLPAGVHSSYLMADDDMVSATRFVGRFIIAGQTYDLPPALLAAISSRETRSGQELDTNGLSDSGFGAGIMSIDNRWYTIAPLGPDFGSQAHINQAASILAGYRTEAAVAHPEWTAAEKLQAGLAAYNGGPQVFDMYPNFDAGTDGLDYSNDVMARAQYYAMHWSEMLVG